MGKSTVNNEKNLIPAGILIRAQHRPHRNTTVQSNLERIKPTGLIVRT